MQERYTKGELDHLKIKVEMPNNPTMPEDGLPPQMIQVQESIVKVLGGMGKKGPEKEVNVKEFELERLQRDLEANRKLRNLFIELLKRHLEY